ncbi:MAG: MarR family winged helix-turn-helix transcriptional regulator [Clostridiaceae bacterium]
MIENSTDNAEKILELYKLLWDDFHEIASLQFRKYKFTAPQAMTIRQLHNTPYITLKELSEKLSLSKGTVSGIVDRLENQGIVVREIPKDNRRTVSLSLSPEFIEDADFNGIKKDYLLNTFKDTSVEDIEKIIYGLEKFHTILASSIKHNNPNEDEKHQ